MSLPPSKSQKLGEAWPEPLTYSFPPSPCTHGVYPTPKHKVTALGRPSDNRRLLLLIGEESPQLHQWLLKARGTSPLLISLQALSCTASSQQIADSDF